MRAFRVGILCLAAAVSSGAFGAVAFVGSRAALAGDDFIDWGTLGPQGTVLSNPFNVNTNGGMNVTVNKMAGGNFSRFDQAPGGAWNGNFSPGDSLLYNNMALDGIGGPVSIVFGSLVSGAGANYQTNFHGDFTVRISAFDALDNLLGSFHVAGFASNLADGSTVFLGVTSTFTDIRRIEFNGLTAASRPQDFAINQLDIVTGFRPIPSPAAALPFALGLLAAGRRRQRA
jgi:hypothetical protein